MSPTVIDGKPIPTMLEDIEDLKATIKELRNRVKTEREIADYWYERWRDEVFEMRV